MLNANAAPCSFPVPRPAPPPQGWTPLQSAVSCGHEEVVALLLRLGADVGAANSGGRTALHYAVRPAGAGARGDTKYLSNARKS